MNLAMSLAMILAKNFAKNFVKNLAKILEDLRRLANSIFPGPTITYYQDCCHDYRC